MPNIDTGNTAFMLLCSSLVMLMTPGLAFFYGGLVGRKNVLAIMIQSFVSMGWTTVIWWAFGFSLCFSGDRNAGPTISLASSAISIGRSLTASHLTRLRRESGDPDDRLLCISDDVCDHHARADHRRFRQPREFQGIYAVSDSMARVGLFPVRAYGLGRRHIGWVGREGFRRRDRRSQYRGHRGAGVGPLCREA